MENGTMGTGLHFDLARAAVQDDAKAIVRLLGKGANPLAQCKEGDTALMFAAAEGCAQAVKALIGVSDLGVRNCNGETALMKAASRRPRAGGDNNGVLEIIMNHSSDETIHAKDNMGLNALMHAVYEGNMEPCPVLLAKINPNDRDKKGRTALMLALSYSKDEIVEMLMASSDILAKDNKGWIARDYAKEAQRYEAERQLLEMERSILAKKELAQTVPEPAPTGANRIKTI